jgi:hydrogenase nickel incorporation protein HypA/HybF
LHELAIALSVLDIVNATCDAQGLTGVRVVRVRVGAAAGLDAEALRFAFDCSKPDTAAAGADLEIEAVPIGGHCDGCGEQFDSVERYVLACPRCGGASFRITRGGELEVVDLEVDG